jgi:hypothetical protein
MIRGRSAERRAERLRLPVAGRQSDSFVTVASVVLLELDTQSASGSTTALGLIEEDSPDLPGLSVHALQAAAADCVHIAVCDQPDADRWREVDGFTDRELAGSHPG